MTTKELREISILFYTLYSYMLSIIVTTICVLITVFGGEISIDIYFENIKLIPNILRHIF